MDEGSPLVVISKECMKKLKQLVDVPVSLAMRYGNPSLLSGLQELHDKGVTK
jgi:ferrochelatase